MLRSGKIRLQPRRVGGRKSCPSVKLRTSNDVPGLKRRTRPSVRLMSSVTDSGDGKHQYAYGRTDGSRAHSAHRHQGWHISSGQGLSPRSGVTRLRSDDPEDGVAGAAPPHPPPHPLRARAEPMPRRRKPASRMRPGRQRGRSRAPSTTGNTAAEPPPRSAATGSAVTARGRRGSSRTFLAVAGAPEAGRPAPRARPGRQRGRSRAPRLGYNAAEPSSRSTGTGSGVTARGRCGRSRTPLTAGKAVDRGPASPGQRPALTVASRGPRPEARTTPILDMWGRHAGSGGDPEETDHLKRAPTRCKTVSVHVGMYRNLAPA